MTTTRTMTGRPRRRTDESQDLNTLPLVCVTAIACTAMVICFLVYLLHIRQPGTAQEASAIIAAPASFRPLPPRSLFRCRQTFPG